MMLFLLSCFAACVIGFVVAAGFVGAQVIEFEQKVDDIEIVYCNHVSLTEVTPVCSYLPLLAVPFSADEIVEIRHPDVEGTVMIFEDASKKDVFAHLSGLGHEVIPGTAEGYVELPLFIQEEMGIKQGEPTAFSWSVHVFEEGVIALFLESSIELERTILYLPY